MKKRFTLSLLLLFISVSVFAQYSTQGTEFWFSFMQNGYKKNGGIIWVETQVMISAKQACSGIVSNPRTSWSMPFTVDDESVVVLSIPEEQGYNENNEGVPSDFGLLLTATDTVSVFIANCATNSFDASFVLPVESLGSNYIVQCDRQSRTQSWWGCPEMETSAFLVMATEDNTVIDINPSVVTFDGHEVAVNYSVTLDRGQTYYMRSKNQQNATLRDLSGTCINARDGKRIAVFNGNTLTTIPNTSTDGHDHIFEQALPVETWGKHFAITSSSSRTRDQVKITAGSDGDKVWCNGVYQTRLSKGQSYTFWLYSNTAGNQDFGGGSCFIETSQPSMVYLYNTTSHDPEALEQEKGDPSMVWIPPIEQKIKEVTFCTFYHDNATIDNHYVNIVVDSESVDGVYLDGVLLNANDFEPLIGKQDLSYMRVEISHGIHHLSCEEGLIAHVYGFGDVKGYAYCAGANVEDLTSVLFVNGQLGANYHDGLHLCIGEDADFEVMTNYTVQSVVWDFDGTMIPGDVTASHTYNQAGEFITKAFVEGRNIYTNEMFYDTLTVAVSVSAAGYADKAYVVCDEDSFEFHGEVYTESGYYEQYMHNPHECDSVFHLTLDMGFTPNFEIVGTHWPIGGSETHFSVNEYAIQMDEPRTRVDTVLWQIDCPNWYVEPQGDKSEKCNLYIYTYLLEPVTLHAWAINHCDTVHEEFSIQTSYFGVEENEQDASFVMVPNPSQGIVTLCFDHVQGRTAVQVFNSLGQKVDTFAIDEIQGREMTYMLPDVPDGLYCFVVKTDGRTWIRKLLLKR